MEAKEKFLALVSNSVTRTVERAKYRIAKQKIIKQSYNNVLQNVCEKYKKQVLENIVNDGWCEMFDKDNNLVSPPFIKLGFSYEFSERHIETKQIGHACYWRPKKIKQELIKLK